MAKALFKRSNPGDAANIFVRNLLCDISEIINPKGFTDDDWRKTILFFNNTCAFTGKKLSKSNIVHDHLIAHNRKNCGLHLFGNIVPTSKELNAKKTDKDFKDFINETLNDFDIDSSTTKVKLIERIEEFQEISGYKQVDIQIQQFVQPLVEQEYAAIQNKCAENKIKFASHDTIKGLQSDIQLFSAKDILPKLRVWSTKPDLKVHKIIAIACENTDGLPKEVFMQKLIDLNISKNPQGSLLSLMSDKGNSYGKVFQENKNIITFVPEVFKHIVKYSWSL